MKKNINTKNRGIKGFSLVEVLVAVGVIAIVATLVVFQISTARASARDAIRVEDVQSIRTALDAYHTIYGKYPPGTTTGGVCGSTNCTMSTSLDTDFLQELTDEDLLNVIPTDPLNRMKDDVNYYYGYAVSSNGQEMVVGASMETKTNLHTADNRRCPDVYEIGNQSYEDGNTEAPHPDVLLGDPTNTTCGPVLIDPDPDGGCGPGVC